METLSRLLLLLLLIVPVGATLLLHPPPKHLRARHFEHRLCSRRSQPAYYLLSDRQEDEVCERDVAFISYTNHINTTGWAFVDVEIHDESVPLYEQGYAAGYVEGVATRELIGLHIQNTVNGYCDGSAADYCQKLADFLLRNWLWMEERVAAAPDDPYWIQVNITLNQLRGLIDGYEARLNAPPLPATGLTFHPIFLIQLAGDLEDLALKFKRPDFRRSGHCSALVKYTGKELFVSHVTWTSYSSMLRIQKRIRWAAPQLAGNTYTFSSYPGSIPSIDDFMLSSAKLAILETTISNYNEPSMEKITINTVLCWIRSQVATRVASTGKEWAVWFSRFNSGTYNNQWMIVDYKRVKGSSRPSRVGVLHVLEQLPGTIVHDDLSGHLLNTTYWPSYNMPYFRSIYEASQTAGEAAKFGDWFTYDRTPRALIFARDHSTVTDMPSMRRLMRSNNYTLDPLSRCECEPPFSGENAIACRSDLNPQSGKYPFPALGHRDHGATDVKITSIELIESLTFEAVAGPTHDPTPVFDWRNTTLSPDTPHFGQPDRWEFHPVWHRWPSHSQYSSPSSSSPLS